MATEAEKFVHWAASVLGLPNEDGGPGAGSAVNDDETDTKCSKYRAEVVGVNEYNHYVQFNIE